MTEPKSQSRAAASVLPAGSPGVNRRGIALMSSAHVVDDMYQGVVPALLPFFVLERHYGRASEIDGRGCDPRLQWDGTADNGRIVPAGVYLLRFMADGQAETMKKILFLGR